MDYATFKPLQFLLLFGAVMAFAVWQLVSVRRAQKRGRSEDPPRKD